MSSGYSPQRHSLQVEELTQLVLNLCNQVARIDGNVQRLVDGSAARYDKKQSELFRFFVETVFQAFGDKTWTVSDLQQKACEQSPEGINLTAAITSIGGDLSGTKSLGKFIAAQLSEGHRDIGNGLEIHYSGKTRTVNAYRVSRVSNPQTNIGDWK